MTREAGDCPWQKVDNRLRLKKTGKNACLFIATPPDKKQIPQIWKE
jgi:hypothetical protein